MEISGVDMKAILKEYNLIGGQKERIKVISVSRTGSMYSHCFDAG